MSWLVAFGVLSLLIFFHELGHYAAARFFGVYVEVFSIGFGKRIGGFRLWNTDWQFAAIPLGGYVRMKGQDDADPAAYSDDNDSYNTKKPWQRIAILFAGPAANFILAFLFLFFIFILGHQSPTLRSAAYLQPIVGTVQPDSPAEAAGIQSNDKIIAINNHPITTWEDMSSVINHADTTLSIKLERGAYVETVEVIPTIVETETIFKEKEQRKMIGIGSAGVLIPQSFGFFNALSYASSETWEASKLIFLSMQKLLTGVVPAKEVGGVVSIVQLTADASNNGWMTLFFFSALISVNLGVLNLLPIPALDGGHIMLNLYEMITKHTPSEAVLIRLTVAGWMLLFGLMTLGLYNDINRIFGS